MMAVFSTRISVRDMWKHYSTHPLIARHQLQFPSLASILPFLDVIKRSRLEEILRAHSTQPPGPPHSPYPRPPPLPPNSSVKTINRTLVPHPSTH